MSIHHDDDTKVLHSMGYAQELARRMSGFSNFAISFSIICILAGGITAYPLALSSGGALSVSIGWLIGAVFALMVAAAIGQIASAYPTAGGLYHWSSILGGRGWGWLTAWINLIGLVFVISSVNFGAYLILRDLVLGGVFHVDVASWNSAAVGDKGWWMQAILITLITITQALFNHFGIRATTIMTDFSGYLIFVVSVLLTLTMLVYGATFDLSRIFQFVNNTGEAGGNYVPATGSFTALLIGFLYPLYTITGFDASAHTSEETVNARHTVPRGMLHSVFWSLLFGFFLATSFVLATPDLAASAKDGAASWVNMYNTLPMPTWLRDILSILLFVANYLCALACMTSTSRMIYAFARDGGLPGSAALSRVNPVYRTPVAAIWTAAILSALACYYAPFMFALAAGAALFLYISYAMPVLAGLLAEGRSWTEFGPFHLGVWSKPIGVAVIIGVVLLTYAGIQPPNDVLYAPLFLADQPWYVNWIARPLPVIFALLVVGWFGSEARRFKGPPIGGEIAERAARIAAAERAVGERN